MPPGHQLATTASATVVTILGSVCSAAWYYTGASTAYAAVTAMPEVMDVAVQGVNEVVEEVVQGSVQV
eukprot:8220988-Karenia_brevis.AAC.1